MPEYKITWVVIEWVWAETEQEAVEQFSELVRLGDIYPEEGELMIRELEE